MIQSCDIDKQYIVHRFSLEDVLRAKLISIRYRQAAVGFSAVLDSEVRAQGRTKIQLVHSVRLRVYDQSGHHSQSLFITESLPSQETCALCSFKSSMKSRLTG